MENNNAIVLAMFGTSIESALPGLLTIRSRMIEQYPATQVRMAFTSKILCSVWQQRAQRPEYRASHPQIPAEVFAVQGPEAIITLLHEAGYQGIIIQPVYMVPAQEYTDLLSLANTMKVKQKTSALLAVGRPALGESGPDGAYDDDIMAAVKALAEDVQYAREQNAALVYMGHGDRHFHSKEFYVAFAASMCRQYPDVLTVVSTVEGKPSIDDAIARLKNHEATKVILKPLMVVAGNHVQKDMIGTGPKGWKNILEKEGFRVKPVLSGLGEQNGFARIFVQHAADAAAAAGIRLR
ncbi:MAG: sirohydrochlorin cobaltochelatase [Desulfobulbales bacterium]